MRVREGADGDWRADYNAPKVNYKKTRPLTAEEEETVEVALRGNKYNAMKKRTRGLAHSFTLGNVGSPFCVYYGKKTFAIYMMDPHLDSLLADGRVGAYTEYVVGGKYEKFYRPSPSVPGQEELEEGLTGCSMLFQLTAKSYMYVGESVMRFKVLEKITAFHPFVGNNNVLYCWAESENWIYFVSMEHVAIEKDIWESRDSLDEDVYYFYYHQWGKWLPHLPLRHKIYAKV